VTANMVSHYWSDPYHVYNTLEEATAKAEELRKEWYHVTVCKKWKSKPSEQITYAINEAIQ